MKKIALILILLPFYGFAQNLGFPGGKDLPNISGMIGIPFGKTKFECITLMKAKGYVSISSKSEYLTFKNVKYGNYKAPSVAFYFYKGKFFQGLVILIPNAEPKAFDEYESLVADINEKYDESDPIRDFKTPYSLGDGYEVTAIMGGYTEISDTWKNKGLGTIVAKINKTLLITVDYYHIDMTASALKEQNTKNLMDF